MSDKENHYCTRCGKTTTHLALQERLICVLCSKEMIKKEIEQ